jgi:beta-lactamase superfamily II metal-dependent hydrolase
MRRIVRLFCLLLPLVVVAANALSAAAQNPATETAKPATFTVWQLPEQTHSQMMSYVIRTVGGKLIVIDGGTAGDASYLQGFLAALGNTVEAWFITHPHSDHVDAVTKILSQPQGLKVGTVYSSLPTPDWVTKVVPADEDIPSINNFREILKTTGQASVDMELGQTLSIDGVQIQVLGIRNPEFTNNCINNSSAVLKMWDGSKSILFLGDLGVDGGEKLLHGPYADKLHADYVQMAHHGQNGVGEAVYQAIRPTHCLWPTPRWLWDNDPGTGKGTGRWKTLEVRAWMDKLNIQHHYVSADGLARID